MRDKPITPNTLKALRRLAEATKMSVAFRGRRAYVGSMGAATADVLEDLGYAAHSFHGCRYVQITAQGNEFLAALAVATFLRSVQAAA